MTNCPLEGGTGNESCTQYDTDYHPNIPKLITAVAPGVLYDKNLLSLKGMKYKTLLMNLNGLPFTLKGMDDQK